MQWVPLMFATLEVADESIVMGSNYPSVDVEHGGVVRLV